MKRLSFALVLLVGTVVSAAEPPEYVNYQGVLRDSANEPLGVGTPVSLSMTFRFFDVGGNEILTDTHTAVEVSGGLFAVQLGSGDVADGSGPGKYTTLSRVFADYSDLYLEVQVSGETLSPRVRIVSAGYALNTHFVKGRDLASDGPLQLYVDAATGDDANDGLTWATTKEHIQAAVDTIPAVIYGDVTVNIAGGTYEELVTIAGRAAPQGHRIVLREASGTVTISGSNIRETVLVIGQVSNFLLEGLDFEAASGQEGNGVVVWDSVGSIVGCNATDNSNAGLFVVDSIVTVSDSTFDSNRVGITVVGAPHVVLDDLSIADNTDFGLAVEACGHVSVEGPVTIANNAREGCQASDSGFIDFGMRSDVTVAGNNGPVEEMSARLHGKIVGYQNATIDDPVCVSTLDGTCYPGQW